MRLCLLLCAALLGFVAAAPPEATKPEPKTINVLVTGFMGAGKSTVINVLMGHYDFVSDKDPSLPALASHTSRSVTLNTSLYETPIVNGVRLRLLDTRGFENANKPEITNAIVAESAQLMPEGIHVFLFIDKNKRTSAEGLTGFFSFLNYMVGEDFDRVAIVRTGADQIATYNEAKMRENWIGTIDKWGGGRLAELCRKAPLVYYRFVLALFIEKSLTTLSGT